MRRNGKLRINRHIVTIIVTDGMPSQAALFVLKEMGVEDTESSMSFTDLRMAQPWSMPSAAGPTSTMDMPAPRPILALGKTSSGRVTVRQ